MIDEGELELNVGIFWILLGKCFVDDESFIWAVELEECLCDPEFPVCGIWLSDESLAERSEGWFVKLFPKKAVT